jgi:hypothetical protein
MRIMDHGANGGDDAAISARDLMLAAVPRLRAFAIKR